MTRCCWSNRCRTRANVVVGPGERFCSKHATWVLDKLVGDWVKARDGWKCMRCASEATIQWAHIITRGARYIRWAIEPYPGNSVALCQGCHFAYTQNEGNWRRWIDGRWPGHRDRLERMNAEAERRGGSIDRAGLITEFRNRLEGAA
jgi:hypothetical protein